MVRCAVAVFRTSQSVEAGGGGNVPLNGVATDLPRRMTSNSASDDAGTQALSPTLQTRVSALRPPSLNNFDAPAASTGPVAFPPRWMYHVVKDHLRGMGMLPPLPSGSDIIVGTRTRHIGGGRIDPRYIVVAAGEHDLEDGASFFNVGCVVAARNRELPDHAS